MSNIPEHLHSEQYYEGLRDLRDTALDESHYSGRRKKIGGFTFGVANAKWKTERGGEAELIDRGLRFKNTTLINTRPTTLLLFEGSKEMGFEITRFEMDVDDIGTIYVYQNLVTDTVVRDLIRAEIYRRADRQHDLANPTEEQRVFLYTEMQRGASGMYPAP